MEPLDQNLAQRLKKISAEYEKKMAVETKKIAIKTEDVVDLPVKERLKGYVYRGRHGYYVRKVDKGDYDLTLKLLEAIEEACLVNLSDLRSSKREVGHTIPRAIFSYVERKLNQRSYPEIGYLLNKDHSSAMHLLERYHDYKHTKVYKLYMRNDKLRAIVDEANKGPYQWVTKA